MILKNEEIRVMFIKPVVRYEVTMVHNNSDIPPVLHDFHKWEHIPKAGDFLQKEKMDISQLKDTLSLVFNADGSVDMGIQK